MGKNRQRFLVSPMVESEKGSGAAAVAELYLTCIRKSSTPLHAIHPDTGSVVGIDDLQWKLMIKFVFVCVLNWCFLKTCGIENFCDSLLCRRALLCCGVCAAWCAHAGNFVANEQICLQLLLLEIDMRSLIESRAPFCSSSHATFTRRERKVTFYLCCTSTAHVSWAVCLFVSVDSGALSVLLRSVNEIWMSPAL